MGLEQLGGFVKLHDILSFSFDLYIPNINLKFQYKTKKSDIIFYPLKKYERRINFFIFKISMSPDVFILLRNS